MPGVLLRLLSAAGHNLDEVPRRLLLDLGSRRTRLQRRRCADALAPAKSETRAGSPATHGPIHPVPS